MSASLIWPVASGRLRPFRVGALRVFPAIVFLLCASLLVALETPSKPFLEKNSFYLSAAGFRVQLANDPAGQKAMRALPAHRFVIHKLGNDVRYLYAEPQHCVCIFVGSRQAYETYRNILSQPLQQADDVSPDYKTQAGALLYGDPYDSIRSTLPTASRIISGRIIESQDVDPAIAGTTDHWGIIPPNKKAGVAAGFSSRYLAPRN